MSSDKINSKIKHNLEVIPYNTNTLSFVHGLFIDVLQGLLQLAVANSDPAEDESATTNRFESDEEVIYFMQHRQGIITAGYYHRVSFICYREKNFCKLH